MKTAILYGSTRGSTQRVVEKTKTLLAFPCDIFNVKILDNPHTLTSYDLLLFFAPTYGDGELQDDMEDFLDRFSTRLSPDFAICELGNYYGYDDFSYGAMRIIREKCLSLGAREMIGPLSLDSLPKKDWKSLERWCSAINTMVSP